MSKQVGQKTDKLYSVEYQNQVEMKIQYSLQITLKAVKAYSIQFQVPFVYIFLQNHDALVAEIKTYVFEVF